MSLASLALVLTVTSGASPALRISVAGVHHDQLAPSVKTSLTERLMRGLLIEGFTVDGPGDLERRVGAPARQALLACVAQRQCDPQQLKALESAAVVVVVATGPFEFEVHTLIADGRGLDPLPLRSAVVLLGDRLEALAPEISRQLHRALERPYQAPPPWTLMGHGAVAGATAFTIAGAALFADAYRRQLELVGAPPGQITGVDAFRSANTGRIEIALSIGMLAVAGGAFFAAAKFYDRGRPTVPRESLQIVIAPGPGSLLMVGRW